MKDYSVLKTLIEKRGVHEQLGPVGEGWGIEQNPHELATFLVCMQELGVQSALEIGTGYRAGLARFLAHEMGWTVTTVDIQDYGNIGDGHTVDGIEFFTGGIASTVYWREGLSGEKFTNVRIWDLLFIDADHSYESIKLDYETFSQHATKAIAFHDITGLRDCEGARKFWWETCRADFPGKRNHKYLQMPPFIKANTSFVIDDSDQFAGIGWIEL